MSSARPEDLEDYLPGMQVEEVLNKDNPAKQNDKNRPKIGVNVSNN